jgi:alanine dehydrogenase
MRIGVPTEIKADERRVAMTPAGVKELAARGHQVIVQAGAGAGSSIADADYVAQGAQVADDAEQVFSSAELIVKVKEPQPEEVALLEPRHVLFTYLHLAPNPALTEGLLECGATCIAYETVTDAAGRLPLLAPMSEVAGKLAAQAGAFMLERQKGGGGLLLGGVAGVRPARVLVIGGGVVGENAARVASGLGAHVCVLDRSLERLRQLDRTFDGVVETCYATALEVEQRLTEADLIIGAVLVAGARAPHVITRAHLALVKEHAVLVDVSIDQGGCFETSRPTTHSDPTFELDGVVHYCVANMPGCVPATSTHALANATLPYILTLADQGAPEALRSSRGFAEGLNVAAGRLTNVAVGAAQSRAADDPADALRSGLLAAA